MLFYSLKRLRKEGLHEEIHKDADNWDFGAEVQFGGKDRGAVIFGLDGKDTLGSHYGRIFHAGVAFEFGDLHFQLMRFSMQVFFNVDDGSFSKRAVG